MSLCATKKRHRLSHVLGLPIHVNPYLCRSVGLCFRARLIICTFLLSSSSWSYAAEIVYIGRSFVIIDAGSDEGLRKGSPVCFEKTAEDGGICGRVKVVRRHFSGLRVRPPKLDSLALKMQVLAADIKKASVSTPATKKELKKLIRMIENNEPPAAAPPPEAPAVEGAASPDLISADEQWPASMQLSLLISPLLPFRYSVPSYDIENEIAETGSLWKGGREVSSSLLGVQLSYDWPLSAELAIVPRLHYRALQIDEVLDNYDGLNPDTTLFALSSANSYGLSTDLRWQWLGGESWGLRLLIGGAFDRSAVSYKGERSDTGEVVATLNSSLSVLGLRLGAETLWNFGAFNLTWGLIGIKPLAAKASVTGERMELKPQVNAVQAASAKSDMKAALAHGRSGFGAAMELGMGWMF